MEGKSFNGSVLEFKLPLELGYAYCKILDFQYISTFDGVLAKVYDCILDKPIRDIKLLRDKDWLFGARRMATLPNIKGRGAWKLKGILLDEDDDKIPDFRASNKTSPFVMDESNIKNWEVVRNINQFSDAIYSFEQVRHLENCIINSQRGIEARTAMEYLRIDNKKVEDYFDLKDDGYQNVYRSMINVPIYSSIPKDIRGRALCS